MAAGPYLTTLFPDEGMPVSRQRPGFTLLELLIVVAVLALLIALLLPSFNAARSQARRVACMSNTSQIGKALQIYVGKYDDFAPLVYGGRVPWDEKKGAFYTLLVESGFIHADDDYPDYLVCPESIPGNAVSYALNAIVFGYLDQENPEEHLYVPPMRLSTIRNPGKVVAIYDLQPQSLGRVWNSDMPVDESDLSDQFTGTATKGWDGLARPSDSGFMWHTSLGEPGLVAEPPHNGAHNVLFSDSHVGSIKAWDPDHMTRKVGRRVNDEVLY